MNICYLVDCITHEFGRKDPEEDIAWSDTTYSFKRGKLELSTFEAGDGWEQHEVLYKKWNLVYMDDIDPDSGQFKVLIYKRGPWERRLEKLAKKLFGSNANDFA